MILNLRTGDMGIKIKKNIQVNHRGRGYIHITWKSNYKSYTDYHQLKHNDYTKDFVEIPELLEELPYSLEASFHFWYKNKINNICDLGDSEDIIKRVSRKVNGGLNGINDRILKFKKNK